MRANELRKYKTLDITELSGSPWNNAEKVLGLDENDKVIMAEPGAVTPEDVADAVSQAMEAETARTEVAYAKKDEIPDMEDYYTKEEVDEAISGITVDLSDYYTKEEVDELIEEIPEPDLSNYYTKGETDGAISTALVPYATKGWVESKTYVNGAFVDAKVNEAMQSETARTESTYAKPSDIPSLDGYATEEYVDDAIAEIPSVDLSGYAKTTAVTQDIQTAMAAETARTESTYLKEHQSLDNYYTKSEVDADFASAATSVGRAIDTAVQGLASEDYVDNAVAGLATEEYVDNAVAGIVFPEDYATTGDVANAVEGLASESYVDNAISTATQGMATQSDLEGLASQEYVDNAVNDLTLGIGMLGMVNDVSESNGTVTVRKTGMENGQIVTGSTSFNIATPGDIQTAIASETARTESTYLKEHQSLDNYYTKSQVDAEITGATEDMATKTWVGQQGYLTQHQDISGKLDKTDFNTYTGATETALAEKLDASAYTVDNAIDSASTNPVENRAINAALNGVTSYTQMEISDVDSSIQMQYRVYGDSVSSSINVYLKETNIDGFYAISIKDLVDAAEKISNPYRFRVYGIIYNDNYYRPENAKYIETTDIGEKLFFTTGSGGYIYIENSRLDGTFEYYLIFNTDGYFCSIYKTLPVITEVTDHKANVSDVPTAQDGSDFKQFVYDQLNGDKRVIKQISGYPGFQAEQNGRRNTYITLQSTYWANGSVTTNVSLPIGNEAVGGIKTRRDSKVISKAEEALNVFTEQITLTIGSASTDTINIQWNDTPLFETNDSRYLVIQDNATTSDAYKYISQITLSGITYYIQNPMNGWDTYNPILGKYQLGTDLADSAYLYDANNNLYLIIDKELLTLEIADSLTITRAKSIPEAISAATQNMVTSGDVATQIDTAMASETARTESTYAKPSQIPSLSGYATEAWVGQQGYATTSQIPTVPTNVSAFNNDAGYLTQQSLTNYVSKGELTGSTETITLNQDSQTGFRMEGWLNTNESGDISFNALGFGSIYETDVNGYWIIPVLGEPSLTSNYWKVSGFNNGKYFIGFPSSGSFVEGEFIQMDKNADSSQYYTTPSASGYLVIDTTSFYKIAWFSTNSFSVETPGVLDDYAKTTDIPVVPTNVSAFNNDAGYLTQHQSLANYYTKTEIDGMIGDIESLLASI